jgi:hypothetical protein
MAAGAIAVLAGTAFVASGSNLSIGALTGHRQVSLADLHLRSPIVSLAATPSGKGFWLFAADGGVFSYGDAKFYGSGARLELTAPIVGMRVNTAGNGYWLFASDGGVFAFGGAKFYGSVAGVPGADAIVSMRITKTGKGYQLTDTAGNVYSFGDGFTDARSALAAPAVIKNTATHKVHVRRTVRKVHRVHVRHKRVKA